MSEVISSNEARTSSLYFLTLSVQLYKVAAARVPGLLDHHLPKSPAYSAQLDSGLEYPSILLSGSNSARMRGDA